MFDQPTDEPRQAQVKPTEFQPRKKQYYVTQGYEDSAVGSWKEGDVVQLENKDALPLVHGGILVPLYQAIQIGAYQPLAGKTSQSTSTTKSSQEDAKGAKSKSTSPTPKSTSSKDTTSSQAPKKFFDNQLEAQVESKKHSSKSESFWDKLK